MEIVRTKGERETRALGKRVAEEILHRAAQLSRRSAIVLTLEGELGAGKTAFAKGFARALGCTRVVSPTYTLMRSWRLGARVRGRLIRLRLVHIDAYRLKGEKEAEGGGIGEALRDPTNIVLVEWPERIAALLPRRRVRALFEHTARAEERKVYLSGIPRG